MKLYVQYKEDNTLYTVSTSRIEENENGKVAEVDVDNYIDLFSHMNDYKFGNGKLIRIENLDYYKKLKNEELNEACKKAISDGFEYEIENEVYHFSLDIEAQLNFQGAIKLFDDGLIENMMWTVQKNGEYKRISISKKIMDELIVAIMDHKEKNISKYRDKLMPIVNNAKSIEEINAITW